MAELEPLTSELLPTLKAHSVFAALPDGALVDMLAEARYASFERGEILLRQEDESDSAVFIVDGAVEILAQTTSGPVRLAAISGAVLLGEIGVLADLPRTATVRATEAGTLLRIGKTAFNRLADHHPETLRYVVTRLGRQVRAFNEAVAVYTNALAALEQGEYDEEMLEHLNNPSAELANFAATFRRMAEQIVVRRRHLDEMANAAAIQRAMLPQPLPADPSGRIDLVAAMRPAREVGGDFYDAFLVDPGRLAITIGDVSGKGVPASLFMAVCQTTIRMTLREDPDDIGRAVERANALLERENQAAMFATFFGAIIDLASGRVTCCNCGHNPPMIRRSDGRIESLPAGGIALGVLDSIDCETTELVLFPGDRLLLYTDGLTEAHDPQGDLFEDDRLRAAFEKHHALGGDAFVEALFCEIDAFAAGAPQHDDLTAFAAMWHGDGIAR